ncbi:MAG: ABC transporter ATP-binding protein [Methanomicrobiales archaeon]|nr:ABC transporter ATP-binding protein [Methanomicrobiales archaeon]
MVRLEAQEISFSYGSEEVLKGIDLALEEGEILGLVGPNGSGKSTLIKCLNRVLHPKGRIRLDGRDITGMSTREIARCIAYVPQALSVGMMMNVFDFVMMGRRPHIGWSVGDRDVEKVVEAIRLLGLEELAFRRTTQISGGERQKVMIARALAQETPILLLDEPTSSLDLRHQMEVMELVQRQAQEKGTGVIVALHDLNLAARYCDRIVMLKGGRIAGTGRPTELFLPEKIRAVYGIEVEIHRIDGVPYLIPIRPSGEAAA